MRTLKMYFGLSLSCTCCALVLLPASGWAAPAQEINWVVRSTSQPAIPNVKLSISYKGHALKNGSELAPSQASDPPEVEFDGSQTYSLMLVDPDVPSPQKPTNKDFVHWLLVNIPKGAVDNGQTVLEYMPPAPPPGTGYHRYIFKLYGQGQDTIQVKPFTSRAKFSPKHFADQYDLGDPLATFYFRAEAQGSVDESK